MSNPAQAEYDRLFSSHDKISSHPDDRETASDVSSSDHDGTTLHSGHDDDEKHSTATMPMASYIPHTSQFDANTGPKGVIADARSFETAKKRSFRQTLYALAGEAPQLFSKTSSRGTEKNGAVPTHRGTTGSQSASPSPSPDLSDSEDEFMRTWRANRLAQLASMQQQDIRGIRRQSPSKRHYGSLVSVDPAGYLDAIEKVGAETTVVVLIYDDESALSGKVEDALSGLARKHPTVRFVKLHFLEAEMDEIAAPGILAYRAGECFANLVSLVTEIPAGREVGRDSIESVLLQHRIL